MLQNGIAWESFTSRTAAQVKKKKADQCNQNNIFQVFYKTTQLHVFCIRAKCILNFIFVKPFQIVIRLWANCQYMLDVSSTSPSRFNVEADEASWRLQMKLNWRFRPIYFSKLRSPDIDLWHPGRPNSWIVLGKLT